MKKSTTQHEFDYLVGIVKGFQKKVSKKYSCEISDYKEFADSGAFRSFDLQAEGDTLDELLDDCHVFEKNQDGGDIRDYKECGTHEEKAIVKWFSEELEREQRNESDPIVDPKDEG